MNRGWRRRIPLVLLALAGCSWLDVAGPTSVPTPGSFEARQDPEQHLVVDASWVPPQGPGGALETLGIEIEVHLPGGTLLSTSQAPAGAGSLDDRGYVHSLLGGWGLPLVPGRTLEPAASVTLGRSERVTVSQGGGTSGSGTLAKKAVHPWLALGARLRVEL